MSPRGLECRYLGIDDQSKNGHVVWVPELGRTKRSVNCIFQEDIDFTDEKRVFPRFKNAIYDQYEDTIQSDPTFFDILIPQKIPEGDLYWKEPSDYYQNTKQESDTELESVMSIDEELKLPPTPKNAMEGLRDPEHGERWFKAMWDEVEQLLEYGTFRIVKPKEGEYIASMKMCLQPKIDNDMNIRYKARLVLRGFTQKKGINYLNKRSPTPTRDTLKISMMYSLKHKMIRHIYDFKSAFIEGYNDFRILARLPPELYPEDHEPVIVEVVRSIYGEKQAAYIWYQRLKEILCEYMGFERLLHDESVFVHKNEDGEIQMILTIYVDDVIASAYTEEYHNEFLKEIKKYVRDCKKVEGAKKYLGIEFKQIGDKLFMNQSLNINKILNSLDEDEKGMIKHRTYPCSCMLNLKEKSDDTYDILSLIGKMRYVVDGTRPDLMAPLGVISENGRNANENQVLIAYQLLSYLSSTIEHPLKLYIGPEQDLELFAFSDASHDGGYSRIGGVFYLSYESGPIHCYSKKLDVVSHSTFEAEIRAIDRCIRQVIVYRELLKELGHKQMEPTIIYTDSEASVNFFKEYQSSKRVKHLMKIVHSIREAVNKRIIQLIFISSEYNVSDLMTKITERKDFGRLQEWILFGYNKVSLQEMVRESNETRRKGRSNK